MLERYNFFKENLIIESIINETFIYYAPPLQKVLNKIKDNKIAEELLGIMSTDIKADVTFVNIDRPGYLSFTTAKNAANNLSKIWSYVKPEQWFSQSIGNSDLDNIWSKHIKVEDSDVYTKSRNSLRIGRFINTLFPGKYNDKQIEEFVNKFKATIENGAEVFEIVEGSDIAKWYYYENYFEDKGTLGNSCMRDKPAAYFEIYVENPEVCRMLILKEDDKILGRALIWKLNSFKQTSGDETEKPEYFLDRQYYIKESDVVKFRNYAKQQGWSYKSDNNYHSFSGVNYKDQIINANMSVKLKDIEYRKFPYLDTFRRYDTYSNILYNDESEDNSYEGQYILSSTSGDYTEIQGGIWSEWHGSFIPDEQAVWSDWADSYLYDDNAIRVSVGTRRNHGWYPEDCEDIGYDKRTDQYIHTDDAVWSENYEHYILAETAVEVIEDIDGHGDVSVGDSNWYDENDMNIIPTSDISRICYSRLADLYLDWGNYSYVHKHLLMRNSADEWILGKFKLSIYNIKAAKDNSVDIKGISALSKIDAMILGYELNLNEEIIVDKFEYHLNIKDILTTIVDLCNKEISKISDILEDKGQLRLKFDDIIAENKYLTKLESRLKEYNIRLNDIMDNLYVTWK